MSSHTLSINGGSSSVKCGLYETSAEPRRLVRAEMERIGSPGATLRIADDSGQTLAERAIAGSDHAGALAALLDWLDEQGLARQLTAVGHRIVHGGPRLTQAQRITPEVVAELERISPLDPNHLPAEISLIAAVTRRFPTLPQVACFDTAFHRSMPRVAQLLPLDCPQDDPLMRRYGFHGLSYTYLMEELGRLSPSEARGRVVLAHLGAGASMAAVRDGRCLDTTMGMTPTGGLVMATRTGDLDPGVLVYLMRERKMNADQIDELVNHHAGLLGVSHTSGDMRDLLARESSDSRAGDAVGLFCYRARQWIGALAATLGGLDTLVFAGGIGENASEVRGRICEGLAFLGIAIAPGPNAVNAPVISPDDSGTSVRVIPTNEELVIVRQTRAILNGNAE
jgi:acetate kinase